MAITKGYSTLQVKTDSRDFIKYLIAKAVIRGEKLMVSDIIEKALTTTYPKELKSFKKFKEEQDD